MRGTRILIGGALPLGLALLICAPMLLGRGVVLLGDMVFVPNQPWSDAWTGGDGSVPRAVPVDAWVALVDDLVPGDLLQRLLLVGLLTAAGAGAARLLPDASPLARAAVTVAYVWNPFVAERLAIGHWALLVGYASLPWVLLAARRLRDPEHRAGGWALAITALAAAAWTSPTGGMLAGAVLVAALAGAGARRLGAGLAVVALVNLPWIVPGVLGAPGQLPPDAFGVEAFAARADTPWGVLGSLLTFGGIWKESIVPPERSVPLLAALALGLVLAGWWGLCCSRRRPDAVEWPVLALGLLGLLAALLPATSWGRPLAEWVVVEVPGGGLWRDSQKWLMPYVLVVCMGLGQCVEWLRARVPTGFWGRSWLVVLVVVPVLALPSLGYGLSGKLRPATFPEEWDQVRRHLAVEASPADVMVVLPFATYRRFDWAHGWAVLDPAPRFFGVRTLTDDALVVTEGVVGGESDVAARVRSAPDAEALDRVLDDAGVRWALLHHGAAGVPGEIGGAERHRGAELVLVERDVPASDEPVVTRRAWALRWLDGVVLGATSLLVMLSLLRRRCAYTRRRRMTSGSGGT